MRVKVNIYENAKIRVVEMIFRRGNVVVKRRLSVYRINKKSMSELGVFEIE